MSIEDPSLNQNAPVVEYRAEGSKPSIEPLPFSVFWPPFPEPPPGVTIILFKDFKPSGIRVSFEGNEEEMDGEGVLTVHLGAKHAQPGEPAKEGDKKKSKKKKKKANVGPQTAAPATWDENWAAGEHLRNMSKLDESIPITERLHEGADAFHSSRKWPVQEVQAAWDDIRRFMGLLAYGTVAGKGKILGQDGDSTPAPKDDPVDMEDMYDDDDFTLETKLEPNFEPLKPRPFWETSEEPPTSDQIQDLSDDIADDDAEENCLFPSTDIDNDRLMLGRMNNFLHDPELQIKYFLSRHFAQKGLFWRKDRRNDLPLLLTFFLRFMVRNQVLPELQSDLEKAIVVAEKACVDLPACSELSRVFPDDFSEACRSHWGYQDPASKPAVFEVAPEDEQIRVDTTEDIPTAAMQTRPEEPQNDLDAPSSNSTDSNSHESQSLVVEANGAPSSWNLWSSQNDQEVNETEPVSTGGWGSADVAEETGWGNANSQTAEELLQNGENAWKEVDPKITWQPLRERRELSSFIGETSTLTSTHAPSVLERSPRRIASVKKPQRGDTGLRAFAQIELAPWAPVDPSLDPYIEGPQLLVESREGVKPVHTLEDTITLLVQPELADKFVVGLITLGLWVQVAPVEPASEDPVKEEDVNDSFWYAENNLLVAPSYWVEVGAQL